jgi:hypothetical protein
MAAISATISGNQPAQIISDREITLFVSVSKVVVLDPLRSRRRAL